MKTTTQILLVTFTIGAAVRAEEPTHVFLLIGQSNMAGRAAIEDVDKETIDGAMLWNVGAGEWQPAVPPYNLFSPHRKSAEMQRLNCGPSFVREYRKSHPDCKVGIVCVARGGTRIEEWKKGRQKSWPLYDTAIAATKAALADGKGQLKGILWHQGEGNSGRPLDYPRQLSELVQNLRADLGSRRVPFVFSQLGPWRAKYGAFNRMIIEQPKLPSAALTRVACVNTAGLTGFDQAHFDSASQRKLGERYAQEMARLLRADEPYAAADLGTFEQPFTLPRSVGSGPFEFEANVTLQKIDGTAASVWFGTQFNFGFEGRAGQMFFETPRPRSVKNLGSVQGRIAAKKPFRFSVKRGDDGTTRFWIDEDEVFSTAAMKGKPLAIRFRPHRNIMTVTDVRLNGSDLSAPPPEVTFRARRTPVLIGSKNVLGDIELNLDRELRLVDADCVLTGELASDNVVSMAIEPSRGEQRLLLKKNGQGLSREDSGEIVLGPGTHSLKLTVEISPTADLRKTVGTEFFILVFRDRRNREVQLRTAFRQHGPEQPLAVAIHRRGEHKCHTTRIPAITRTPKGTLLAVYDLRYNSRRDLQEDIDIGLSRSTDNGQTWEPIRPIMDMGEFGGKSQRQNGCSDPNILVDKNTGEIFVSAVWTHGKPNTHQWAGRGSEPGFGLDQSSQFMMVSSTDDGVTWSKPRNLTRSLKNEKWWLFAPAPGNGITLKDGTLVMPTQGRDEKGFPFSNLMSSRDHGKTWKVSPPARNNTTECSVAELSDGSLMLNMRDNRNRADKSSTNGRAISVTSDFGQSWTKHKTDHRSLPEPVCMASLISHRLDRSPVLVFSNPYSRHHRRNMTVQFSFDDGKTWPVEHHVLLDEDGGAYSSLVPIDRKTVGIIYESSQANLLFQLVPMPRVPRKK